jgi:hypothetical protein
MATNEEQNPKKPQNGRYEFLRKPRTYPENWDLSAISMPDHAGSNNGNHSQTHGSDSLVENYPSETSQDQVSFTEWQLSRHLDQYDKPEQEHFSAY